MARLTVIAQLLNSCCFCLLLSQFDALSQLTWSAVLKKEAEQTEGLAHQQVDGGRSRVQREFTASTPVGHPYKCDPDKAAAAE